MLGGGWKFLILVQLTHRVQRVPVLVVLVRTVAGMSMLVRRFVGQFVFQTRVILVPLPIVVECQALVLSSVMGAVLQLPPQILFADQFVYHIRGMLVLQEILVE